MFITPLKVPHLCCTGACVLLALLTALAGQAHAQSIPPAAAITAAQLKTLLPDEQDLQGFVRIRPAFDTSEGVDQPLPDHLSMNVSMQGAKGQPLTFSGIGRALYSQSKVYWISMAVSIYDSAETAHNEVTAFREHTQSPFQPIELDPSADDETWFNRGPRPSSVLLFRRGRAMVVVRGALTFKALKEGGHTPFPPASVLAIGHMIALRLARQPHLTSVPTQDTRVAVNGQALPDHAVLLVGKQVYVPVTEFAKAAGWTSHWDVTTGALTLTSPTQQHITLAAGSTAVKQGATAAPALKCPVLKEANQPVMVLTDLLTLTKGRITEQQGNSFKITV